VTATAVATRAAVVVNPSKVVDLDARKQEVGAALAAAGWAEPQWLETTREDPGRGQTRQAIADGASVVFAYGGDGTVMAVATELAGTEVAMAVLPSGTGNLLAANLGLATDLKAAVEVALHGDRRRIDVGAVGDRCFTVMAGMGFDAQMLDATPERLKKHIGWPAYMVSGMKQLRHRPMRIRLTLDDGEPMARRARSVLVGNVGRLQGGIPLLPDARPDDGHLDVAVLSPQSLGHWAQLAWGVVRKRETVSRMQTYRAKKVEIVSTKVQSRELDGDVIEPGRSLTVTVRPGALCLCVPKGGPPEDLARSTNTEQ
jgi:YegS/Rv2252/BmrU family lipid kinase